MKNINFSFPQGKFRKNDLFLELKSKKIKGKYMKKVSLLALSGIVALALLGCDGGVAHSLKEVCDNPKTKYESLEADVYYKLIEFPIGTKKDGPKGNYIEFYDANGDEKIHIHQDPSNIMGYGIKNVKKEGEVFKLKGELPKCIGDTVILKLIREE